MNPGLVHITVSFNTEGGFVRKIIGLRVKTHNKPLIFAKVGGTNGTTIRNGESTQLKVVKQTEGAQIKSIEYSAPNNSCINLGKDGFITAYKESA